MAEQLVLRYGIPRYYADFEEMLQRERPDVVHIATPPQSHVALAMRALEHGCHLFIEKPLALNYASARQLVEIAAAAGKHLTVGYIYQFDPVAERLRKLVRSGALGEIVHLESFYGYNLQGPFGAAFARNPDHWVHALPGKLFHNIIDHCLNKIPEFISDEDPAVHSVAYSRTREATVPEELRVAIRGASVSANCTISASIRPLGHFLRVYGTKRTAQVDYVSRTIAFDGEATLPSTIGRVVPPFGQARRLWSEGFRNVLRFTKSDFHFFAGLNTLIAAFYESIHAGGPPPISSRDMLWVSRMTDRIFQQIDEHGSE